MTTQLRKRLKTALWNFPITGDFLYGSFLRRNFQTERRLIHGRYENASDHASIIHFSVNKAATQYVRDLLGKCASETGMTRVRLADYAFHTKFPYLDTLSVSQMKNYSHVFHPTGYLYSVFGGMIEGIADFQRYHVLFMVRDPRDVLVSEYFSYGFSHAVPSSRGNKLEGFMVMRRKAQGILIDDYVISESERVNENYQRYINLLLGPYPHVHVAKYEDMVVDFQPWLESLLQYCGLAISARLFQLLVDEAAQLRPIREDVHKHIRKGKSGDYKEKLKKSSIDFLNTTFSNVLAYFNYPLD
jgi:hypothetical protein